MIEFASAFTGLQHNLFRGYDSALGQWLSEDPIGFGAGDENLRRYTGNGVTNAMDPLGWLEFPITIYLYAESYWTLISTPSKLNEREMVRVLDSAAKMFGDKTVKFTVKTVAIDTEKENKRPTGFRRYLQGLGGCNNPRSIVSVS